MDLFALSFPWDKLIGPFVTLMATVAVAYVRKGAKALDAMKANIDAVPELVKKVEEATKQAEEIGHEFAKFAHESTEDRASLHRRVHTIANQQATNELLVQGYVDAGKALVRIADRLDLALPPRRATDPPDADFSERRTLPD